ncbi:multicopper oxidase domain-containing protein [Klugiella xanthotipulae]|uniref:Multicopper oxidase CueO n=1 Tax=Klugiella xanthotipulae TaxID=244735 RepID=A0A543HT77_9MICO|nr:multicopper oxidase domain-containing protein [Klugiella xanthotipulae]TQM61518.1 cell division protein SufI [Klugiella xanthotipulae]
MSLHLSRRTLLIAAASTAVLSSTGCTAFSTRDPLTTAGKLSWRNPLQIPPLAEATVSGNTRAFTLTAQTGSSTFLPGKTTPTWGYNGNFLGPTLRASAGEKVAITFTNSLPEPTALHWHGMQLPAAMDGGPHQLIDTGATWSPTWTITQDAATLWYHPHPHGQTEAHVTRGLAGFFLIDDDNPAGEQLPHEYGVDDIPLVVQDRTIEKDGTFTIDKNRAVTGLVGNTILVNGTVTPYLPVTTSTVRLRILNGSSARIYNFGFADDREFQQVATDNGLLAKPLTGTRIPLSPGERAEIVVAVAAGEKAVLRSYPQDLRMTIAQGNGAGGADTLDILELRGAATVVPSLAVPAALAAYTRLDREAADETRGFELNGRQINGKTMDMSRIDTVVAAGACEVWTVKNSHAQAHNFHVHNARFQVIEMDGKQPEGYLDGWKDTVFLPARSTAVIIMKMSSYTDPNLPYMYHCHMLWHEDLGMMGQFTIVKPDEVDTAPRTIEMSEHEH